MVILNILVNTGQRMEQEKKHTQILMKDNKQKTVHKNNFKRTMKFTGK